MPTMRILDKRHESLENGDYGAFLDGQRPVCPYR